MFQTAQPPPPPPNCGNCMRSQTFTKSKLLQKLFSVRYEKRRRDAGLFSLPSKTGGVNSFLTPPFLR